MGTAPTPPGPGLPPAGPTCAACRAPVRPTDRFCPSCGATLGGSASPSTAPTASVGPAVSGGPAPPVDIRTDVDQDRGMLKRLQLLIPGFRGYRQGEDIREADSLLRLQIADKVRHAMDVVTNRRQLLSQAGQFGSLMDLAMIISELTTLEGRIRHAEQGYTGISPALKIDPSRLDRLYEYDYGFAQAADAMEQSLGPLADPSADPAGVAAAVVNVRTMISNLERAFQARIEVIEAARVP